MALKKAAKNTETEDKTTTEAPTPEPEATAPAVAPKPETPVPTSGPSSVYIKNDDQQAACSAAEYGTFVAVSASNGEFAGQDISLGKEMEFQVVVQRDVWKLSANDDSDEAREYFTVSYEGEEDLSEALAETIDAGYEKASVKKYLELYALVTKCKDNSDMEGEVICLNLSPSSMREWGPLAGKLTVRAALGKLQTSEVIPGSPAVTFRAVATPGTWKGKKYTYAKFFIV